MQIIQSMQIVQSSLWSIQDYTRYVGDIGYIGYIGYIDYIGYVDCIVYRDYIDNTDYTDQTLQALGNSSIDQIKQSIV